MSERMVWNRSVVGPQPVAEVKTVPEESDYQNPPIEAPKGKWRTSFTYFIESTSFQGIPKIWVSPRILGKLMWTVFFLAATGMMIYQLNKLFTEYYSWPSKTDVSLGFSALAFPSVTICNTNPVRLSKVKLASCDLQKAFQVDEFHQSEACINDTFSYNYDNYASTEWVCEGEYENEVCYEVEVTGLDAYYLRSRLIQDMLSDTDQETRQAMGHQLSEMLLECTLNNKKCYASNFTQFYSFIYGNCYTLNSKGFRASKSGPGAGLDMTLNIETEEMIESYGTGYGLRMVIHENATLPFPGSEGFMLSSGAESHVIMKLINIQRLSGKYGICNKSDEFMRMYGIQYSEKACRELCLKTLTISNCSCQPGLDFGFSEKSEAKTKYCATQKEWQCQDKVYINYIASTTKGANPCHCGAACVQKDYDTRLTTRDWPILTHLTTLEAQVCKDNNESHPKCEYGEWTVENYVKRKSSFVRVRVYYGTLNYESITESPEYTLERFLSDIGGTLGLWIGCSVLSLVEVLEILMEVFFLMCKRK